MNKEIYDKVRLEIAMYDNGMIDAYNSTRRVVALVTKHNQSVLHKDIEDIHPYASMSNESTSMQEACLQAVDNLTRSEK